MTIAAAPHTISKWPPARVLALANHVGGRVTLSRRTRLSYAAIARLISLESSRPHALTIMALDRIARASGFERGARPTSNLTIDKPDDGV